MESNEATLTELLAFFKTLADPNRLKIVGLLTLQARSAKELASALKLKPMLVLRHLDQLAQLGVVCVSESGCAYEFQADALYAMSKRLLAGKAYPQIEAQPDEDVFTRKVMADFTGRDGRLKDIPAQPKKREVILRRLLAEFQVGQRYSEKEVNAIIKRFHDDTASLRRYLVDLGWLKREAGVYWRE